MSISVIVEVKNPGEVKNFSVDFTNGLDVGDSISSQEIKVYESGTGTDVTSTIYVTGSVGKVGNVISARFQNGTDGKKYNLRYSVTTVGGETLYHFLILRVKNEAV